MLPAPRRPSQAGASPRSWAGALARLSAGVLVLLVAAQRLRVGFDDPYGCKALLDGGSWPPDGALGPGRSRLEKWEPGGCTMHEYTRDEVAECLRDRRVVFVGDSTTRQLFWAAATRLDHRRAYTALLETFVSADPQHDLALDLEGVQLRFVWDPWLNSTGLRTELLLFRADGGAAAAAGGGPASAALVVLGAPGLWAARHGGGEYLDVFKRSVELVRPFLEKPLGPGAPAAAPYRGLRNQLLMAPVPVPSYEGLSFGGRRETLTPERIDALNGFLRRLPAAEATHVLWAFNDMTRGVDDAFREDGFHVRDAVGERRIDLPLNARCNAGLMNRWRSGRTTCCAPYPALSRGQRALFLAAALALPLLALLARSGAAAAAARLPDPGVLAAAASLALAAGYAYLADRTHLFAHAEKHFALGALVVPLVALAGAGALSLRRGAPAAAARARAPPRHGAPGPAPDDPGFLPRAVTDEWKGAMLALHLLVGFQQTAGALWASKLAWLFTAASLFLSAYGHAAYFLRTGDFSLRRAAAVLFRLNALPCLLGWATRGDWLGLYGLPRLVSLWFLVTYAALRAWPAANHSPPHLLLKVVLAAAATTVAIEHDYVGALCRLARPVLRVGLNAPRIRDQLSLDRFAPYAGILVAGLAHRCALLRQARQHHAGRRALAPPPSLPRLAAAADRLLERAVLGPGPLAAVLRPAAALSCAAGLAVFFFEAFREGDDGPRYRLWHPVSSLVPVLAYAVLRCSCRPLRAAHLALPAALARPALEAALLHRHVWLAGDGGALLRTGLFGRGGPGPGGGPAAVGWHLETALLTVVFLWASDRAQRAARALAAWLVGGEGGGEGPPAAEPSARELEKGTAAAPGEGLLGGRARAWAPARARPPRGGLLHDVRLRVGLLVAAAWAFNLYCR